MKAPAMAPANAPIIDFSKIERAFIRVLDCILRLDWVDREDFEELWDVGFVGFGGFCTEAMVVEEKGAMLLLLLLPPPVVGLLGFSVPFSEEKGSLSPFPEKGFFGVF